jgi:uroporphyrinogen-III synthase
VLVTRPEPGLSETMADVAAHGWNAWAAPLLRIERAGTRTVPPRIQAVLATSGQALAFLPDGIARTIPFFAVGAATARRAREAGFADIRSADGNAHALGALTMHALDPAGGTLLLLSGAGHGIELAAELRRVGFRVVRRVVYRARAVRHLPSDARDALARGEIAAILFFSAETARVFFLACPEAFDDAFVRAISISAGCAQELSQMGWRGPIELAARPDASEMLARLGSPAAIQAN